MIILWHRKFKKSFKKTPDNIKDKFDSCMEIFLEDKFDYRLHNHALIGKYSGLNSINITGDWRVIYKEIDASTVTMMDIGTHSQLYG